MSYVRGLFLRSTFAATAPRSAVAELGVVRRCYAHPVIRCPKCSKLVVRDVTRCECGHRFDGTESDAAPTPQDVVAWQHTHSDAPPTQSPSGRLGIRIVVIAVAFGLAVLIGPAILQASAGPTRNWSGSLLPLILLPIVFGILWLLFSVVAIGALVVRDGSRISSFACIGIGFLLALVGTLLVFALLPPVPPYGHGP